MKTGAFHAVVDYLHDDTVDVKLDRQLRTLLTTCFTKPHDAVFKRRRYFIEPYPHRWVVRDDDRLIAHVGVHEKAARAAAAIYGIGGLAEVCVHPDFRGRGIVRDMIVAVHEWLRGHGFVFSILMGDPRIYTSSVFRTAAGVYCDGAGDAPGARCLCGSAMVCELADVKWPDGDVYISGPSF